MKSWLGTLAILLSACGGGSSKSNENLLPKVVTLPDLSAYDDYAVSMSSDGQRAAFLSQRQAGFVRAFIFDNAAESKLKPFAELVKLESGDADELRFVLSRDGQWLLVERFSPTAHQLVLSSWDGSQTGTFDLDENVIVTDVGLEGGATPYVTYAATSSAVASINVLSATPAGSTLNLVTIGTFVGERRPIWARSPASQLTLFTEVLSPLGWRARSLDETSKTWQDAGLPLTLQNRDADSSAVASAKGLIFSTRSSVVRSKLKLGSNQDRPEGYVPKVSILDGLAQMDPFAGSALNFSAETYLTLEPSTLSSLAATADGSYLLLTGSDTYFCKTRQFSFNGLLLVRTSDMSAVPIFISKKPSDTTWTEIRTHPCSVLDDPAVESARVIDRQVDRGMLETSDGKTFQVVYESRSRLDRDDIESDREVRHISFRVDDWDSRNLSWISGGSISANVRP